MTTETAPRTEGGSAAPSPEARGAQLEATAFAWCRIGTICLLALAPRYALLLAGTLSILFYVRAMRAGVTRSDCILRRPALIVGFWALALAADLWWLAQFPTPLSLALTRLAGP